MSLIQQIFHTVKGSLWLHAPSFSSLLQIRGILTSPQATHYHTNIILQSLLLSPPLRYLRKMSTSFSLFFFCFDIFCLLFFYFFQLKKCLITNVESLFLYADNPLCLFIDELFNETMTLPPPETVSNEEESKEPIEKTIHGIKVTILQSDLELIII